MNAIFTGRKRSGKTTLAFDMAMKNEGGIIVFDPKGEWRGWPGTVYEVSEIEKKVKEGHAVVVLQFERLEDANEKFDQLADYVWGLHKLALDKGWDKAGFHFTLIVDEAINVSDANFVNEKLLRLVSQNRPEILSIYLTFQAPKDVNNGLKNRSYEWFVFNTSMRNDLIYLHDKLGIADDDLRMVQNLRPHEYAHFTFDGDASKVDFNFKQDEWYRPLSYSELNAQERGEEMARKGNRKELLDDLRDLVDELEDMFGGDDDDDERERGRGRDRDRGRGRDRERSRSGGRLEGY